MGISYFNSLSRQIEPFIPLDPAGKSVSLYTCGPTVYNYAHIGNFRAYIFEDLLQRHLEFRGYTVDRVMNLTDVDDKTIRGCRAAGLPLAEFTQTFKEAFFQDLKALRIKEAGHFPSATEDVHIARMIEMISTLIERGHAYQADDGSVYFRINSFPAYGRLAHLNLDELRPSGRVNSDEYEKENIGDFALWKTWDEADGDVVWESPWGGGRPGWHIECSAMATGILGPRIDIHCGGEDNIFPHHEAEIAQSECVTGEPFVKLWMHCKHLLFDNQKMSKSAGNFYTLRDLLDKGWTGREVRYALLSVKYREPLNFTFDSLAAARSALGRLDEWSRRIDETARSADLLSPHGLPTDAFGEALDDDLNISAALGAVFVVIRETNKRLDAGTLAPSQARALAEWRDQANSILRFEEEKTVIQQSELGQFSKVFSEVAALLEERERARSAQNWAESDRLRDEIAKLGWTVKDTKDGQKLSRI